MLHVLERSSTCEEFVKSYHCYPAFDGWSCFTGLNCSQQLVEIAMSLCVLFIESASRGDVCRSIACFFCNPGLVDWRKALKGCQVKHIRTRFVRSFCSIGQKFFKSFSEAKPRCFST